MNGRLDPVFGCEVTQSELSLSISVTLCSGRSRQSPVVSYQCLSSQQCLAACRCLSLSGGPLLSGPYCAHHSLGTGEEQVLCLF